MLALKNACDDQIRLSYLSDELRLILCNFWSSRIWEIDFIQIP